MPSYRFLQKAATLLIIVSSLLLSNFTHAQAASYIGGYKQIKRLGGTSQSICRPAIRNADELQSFALNQRQDVIDILDDANWEGNPDDVFAAIEAGEFAEKSFPVGSKFEWMGLRENGKPGAAEKRQWAGAQAFDGFELNIISNCVQYQLVIPKPCCNVSLAKSTPVKVVAPEVMVSKEGNSITISVDSYGVGEITQLTYPDGHRETLTLSAGSWTGVLEPGDYTVNSMSATDCGESTPVILPLSIPAAMAPIAMAGSPVASGPFFAPFVGRQVRNIDPPLIGIQAGWLNPLSEKVDWFIQGGGSYNLDAEELSIFIDLGIDRKIGKGGFIGAGVGLWDINNSDNLPDSDYQESDYSKKDVSYFIHGGANTPWQFHKRPVQWFAEARIFDDFTGDIANNNIMKLGLRYMY